MDFRNFLKRYKGLDNAGGDFASDALSDVNMPNDFGSIEELKEYLEKVDASEDAINIGCELFSKFKEFV